MAKDIDITEKISNDNRNIFAINVNEKSALYKMYMPFITQGGIFIPTNTQYQLGDEIYILLKILDAPEKHTVSGQVIWITPPCAQGGRSAGIGVQLSSDEGNEVRNKIEGFLAGALKSETHTNTM